ncbi:MAG: polysaccharide deacetylase [Firmicutes bacterium]|nr:polysaccharide deacetylase [Bacillota bacterium]
MSRRGNIALVTLVLFILAVCWLALPAKGVPILAYHCVNDNEDIYSVSPEEFDRQMKYLTEQGYTAISLHELTQSFLGGAELPAKPIVITFDDGYQDNYTTALPIMKKYGMIGTVFVITDKVDQPGYLTWAEIKDMQAQEFEIGSHTVSHAVLSELESEQKAQEVTLSKRIIEEKTGRSVEFLAYPFGNYDISMFDILRQAGYAGACTGTTGLNKPGANAYRLKRIGIPRTRFGLFEFRLRLWRAEIYSKF